MSRTRDLGYFGPDSVSWQVHREVTVPFGGARALLMQEAHPLVVAGANQTGMYERNPWRRLQRTLILTYTITFGTNVEVHGAAERINVVHTRINGIDPVRALGSEAAGIRAGSRIRAARAASVWTGRRASGARLPRVADVRGVLLDIDGVLTVSWRALPGAADALAWLRREGIPFRLITNTTTQTCRGLAQTLGAAGFEVTPAEIVTAVVATASYLRGHHPGAGVFVLSDGDAREDLEGVDLVDVDEADVVVLGGAGEDFTYPTLNRVFRRLADGATLVGMHRNLYWRTAEGWQLDGGAYVAGLEEATGRRAAICGKPSAAFFEEALRLLGAPAESAVMVGDDVVNDVLGAQAAGITGVLVRTGKFLPTDLERAEHEPDHVLDSVADLPGWLRAR